MHQSHQNKLLSAGFTLYFGCFDSAQGLVIKKKTFAKTNWHTHEKDFKSKAELKRRLVELDKKKEWIDLYDTKNTLR